MEARQTLGASSLANGVRILLAIFVAIVLVGAFALIGQDLGASRGGNTEVHPAPGTVLRQDNPAPTSDNPAPGTVLRQDYDRESGPSAPSIYVQSGRPQAVYDEIARTGQQQ